jgi:hypothetical protein
MAAPLKTRTTIEQRGVVCFLWAKNMDAAKDMHKEMLPIWAAFLCGYPLLRPNFLPTKNTQRHAVLSWYMYSGVPPSCNFCYVCTVMRIPIVVRHKTRYCCYLAVAVSRAQFKNLGRNLDLFIELPSYI